MFAQSKNKISVSALNYTIIVSGCSSGSRIFLERSLIDKGYYDEMLSSSER